MKKMKRILSIIVVLLLAVTIMIGCSKEEEFDASGYVKSSLDAVYHQEYEAYAKFLGVSEEEAKSNLDEDFQERINQEFTGIEGITAENISQYSEMMRKISKMGKYEVKEATKNDEGNYIVKVQVEPSDIYQTLEKSSEEVSVEKMAQGLDPTDPEVFVSVLTESVQKSIDKASYGQAVTLEVEIAKDDSKTYSLKEPEMDKIGHAMFPNE